MDADNWTQDGTLVEINRCGMTNKKQKFSVYFVNPGGSRDGMERIVAPTKEEAIAHYKRFFNVERNVRAIPIFER